MLLKLVLEVRVLYSCHVVVRAVCTVVLMTIRFFLSNTLVLFCYKCIGGNWVVVTNIFILSLKREKSYYFLFTAIVIKWLSMRSMDVCVQFTKIYYTHQNRCILPLKQLTILICSLKRERGQ